MAGHLSGLICLSTPQSLPQPRRFFSRILVGALGPAVCVGDISTSAAVTGPLEMLAGFGATLGVRVEIV
jgi:hypothetical protein